MKESRITELQVIFTEAVQSKNLYHVHMYHGDGLLRAASLIISSKFKLHYAWAAQIAFRVLE